MKTYLKLAIAIALAGISLQSASAASVTLYSSTQVAKTSFLDFNLGKFDSNLGTLTGVTIFVDFSTLQGSVIFSNNEATDAQITQFDSVLRIQQKTSDLGYATRNSTIYDVATTPDWNGLNVAPFSSKTFVIQDSQSFSIASQNIGSSYFSAYQSVGGSGNVTMQVRATPTVSTSGTTYTLNSSNSGANTRLGVTYTYTAIPEPSTYALFGLGGVALVIAARRKRTA